MSPNTKPKTLDAYVRVSRVGGREGESYITKAQQRDAIERWCGLQGYTVARWHEEEDRSGGDALRPKWNEALRRALDGEVDGVIVAKLDRFARSAVDGLKAVTSLEDAGRTFVSVAEKFDTADPYGRFTATVFFALAELELGRIKTGWKDARERAIARGTHIGPTPAGFSKSPEGRLEPNEHAPAIRAAFELRAKGGSWSQIARLLTEAGVPTSRNSTRWSLKAAEKLTRNEVYLGVVRSGEFRQQDAHPAIISPALFRVVERRRETRARGRGESQGRLLSGLLRCATCGHRLTLDFTVRSGKRYAFYRCRNTGVCERRASIGATVVETLVVPVLEERMLLHRVPDPTSNDKKERLRADLAAAEEDLLELLVAVREGAIKAVAAAGTEAAVRDRIEAAQAELEKAESRDMVLALSTTDAETIPSKRSGFEAFLNSINTRILVAPGRGTERVSLESAEGG
jgi:site-specific DNA recombinase